MEFVCILVEHRQPCGATMAASAMEAVAFNPVWPGSLPGAEQELSEAVRDYNDVIGAWTANPLRARRFWRQWTTAHEDLAGVDPFAHWDLALAEERLAFAALSGLARHSDEAMSAWCAKSAPLWRRYFSTAHGRRHYGQRSNDAPDQHLVVTAEGASLTALALALVKLGPAQLRKKSHPFHAVMAQARQSERRRRVLPKKPAVDPRHITGTPTDGMDLFAEVTDTMTLLRHMVQTHEPRHQHSMRRTIEEQVSTFLGETPWSSTASLQNRQKLKRRRNQLQQQSDSVSAIEAVDPGRLGSRQGPGPVLGVGVGSSRFDCEADRPASPSQVDTVSQHSKDRPDSQQRSGLDRSLRPATRLDAVDTVAA